MDGHLAVALAVCMVIASAVAAVPVGGSPAEDSGGYGVTISAFMQSSAAETAGSVENKMWLAAFNRSETGHRAQLVQSRSSTLEQKIEQLQAERAELLNESNGDVTPKERAKAARLAARIESLNEAINHTVHAATVTGVDAAKLDQLRTQAKNLEGPEVAAMARGLAGKNKTVGGVERRGDNPGPGKNSSGATTGPNTEQSNVDGEQGAAERGNASRPNKSKRSD